MRQLPPLAAVRVFEAAARHLNFTLAGQELGMTQAAVSYQIRALEERLGLPLFAREKGRVRLTEAGRRAAPQISGAFDALGDAFAGLRSENEAVLTISSANSIAANWLAPRLGSFQLAHPELAVRLLASYELADFARDEIDCAVRVVDKPGDDLHGERLFDTTVMPMASPDWLARHPLREPADALSAQRLSPDDIWWELWFEAVGVSRAQQSRPGLWLDSQLLEGSVALSGQGLAILEPLLWARELSAGRLVAPFPIGASTGRCYWLVCPQARRNVRKIKLFREWLLAEVAAAYRPTAPASFRPAIRSAE